MGLFELAAPAGQERPGHLKSCAQVFENAADPNGKIQCQLAVLGSQLKSIHRLLAWGVLGSATGGCLFFLPGIVQAECQCRAASEIYLTELFLSELSET